uniref:Uncharacterized protein n=1 Tax=viral metagenome TaxID=1070528 RepID=A0A6M3X474_9ZZZZ
MAWIIHRKVTKIQAKIDNLEARGYTLSGGDVYTGQLQGFVIAKEILENP